IPVAAKKDSQGICFIGNIKMSDFLGHYIPDSSGEIVNLEGKVVGEHRGLHLYTLGQRKGLGVASNTYGKAYVVVEKRPQENQLVVAFDEPDTPRLYAERARIGSISITNRKISQCSSLLAQPRYRHGAMAIEVEELSDDETSLTARFLEPQRALTPGQICGFYEGDCLVGGGIFQEILY
ncbi:MAG: tRNA methyl transferase PRC-barrel domain-containing protein, partial [Verrucomicrobiota bacterium]